VRFDYIITAFCFLIELNDTNEVHSLSILEAYLPFYELSSLARDECPEDNKSPLDEFPEYFTCKLQLYKLEKKLGIFCYCCSLQ